MGINILGFATSIKTENLSEITDLINIEISEKLSSSIFEEAISNNIEDDEMYLTTTTHGSIITAGENFPLIELVMRPLSENQNKLLKFLYSETAMAFCFVLLENGKVIRKKNVYNNQITHDTGKSFAFEFSGIEIDEVIMEFMKLTSGDSIYTLEPDHISKRYKYIGEKQKKEEVNNKETDVIPQNKDIKKPWWKIW